MNKIKFKNYFEQLGKILQNLELIKRYLRIF